MAFLAPIFEAVIDVAVTGSALADAASTLAASLYSATEAAAVEASVAESIMPGALETEEAVVEGDLLGSAGASKVGEGGSFLRNMYFSEGGDVETLASREPTEATTSDPGIEAETEGPTTVTETEEGEILPNTEEFTEMEAEDALGEEEVIEEERGEYEEEEEEANELGEEGSKRSLGEPKETPERLENGAGEEDAEALGKEPDAAQTAARNKWMSAFFQVGLLLAGIVPGIAQGEVQQKQAIKRETEEIEAQVRIQQEEMLIQGIGDLFGRTAQ